MTEKHAPRGPIRLLEGSGPPALSGEWNTETWTDEELAAVGAKRGEAIGFIAESALRSLRFEVVPFHDSDDTPYYGLKATWPNGNFAGYISLELGIHFATADMGEEGLIFEKEVSATGEPQQNDTELIAVDQPIQQASTSPPTQP
jgi:hypothetical protein